MPPFIQFVSMHFPFRLTRSLFNEIILSQQSEEKFNELVQRKDMSMVLITQGCADEIRYAVDAYTQSGKVIPTVLEIPSKEQPYDPRKDCNSL